MFKKNFKIAIRNAIKHKGTTLINIFGLSCGMAICIIIMAYVSDQLSYDKHHLKNDRIYRVVTDYSSSGTSKSMSTSPWPAGPAFSNSIPEIESYTRVYQLTRDDKMVIEVNDVKFEDKKLMLVDSTFFDVMTCDFIYGDSKNALLGVNNVVITNTVSEKLFGKVNPVGEFIKFDAHGFGKIYQISAVVNDKNVKTHLKFNYLIPIASAPKIRTDWMETWLKNYTYTYLCLKQNNDTLGMVMKMHDVFREQSGESADKWGTTVDFTLQNISDIHLTSDLDFEFEANGDIKYIYYFSFAGLFILIIAIINFINLITVQSFSRAKEIGITKCIGGSKKQLIWQFLCESVFISFLSFLVAVVMVMLILPYYNSLLGISLSLDDFNKPSILSEVVLIWLFSGVGAGIYPAFVLSSYKPISTLKGEINRGLNKNRFIKGLVIFQFAITSILIFATFMVQKQVNFLQNKKMNFNTEQTIVIRAKDEHTVTRPASVKKEFLKNPAISMATFSYTYPGLVADWDNAFYLEGKDVDESIIFRFQLIDFDYFDFFGLKVIEGREFDLNLSSDSTDAYILNETAVKQLNINNNVVGRRLKNGTWGTNGGVIIGVVKDFSQESLKNSIVPLVYKIYPTVGFFLSLRINSDAPTKELDWIKKKWKSFEPDREMEYFFMDDYFNQLYINEERMGNVYLIFSIITILIATLGLFSLISFMSFNRKKEIGIRKVLGASNKSIYLLLSKDFIKWIIIANVIAFPIGYYFIFSWLNNYAFKTEIDVYIFLYTMLIGVFVALVTLSYRVVKISRAKPVDSLKTE